MKTIFVLAAVLSFCMTPHGLDSQDRLDAEELFVLRGKSYLDRYDVKVTSDQEEALHVVFPLFRRLNMEGLEATPDMVLART